MAAGWTDRAACKGMDSKIFFGERGDTSAARKARAVCAGCEVRAECLQFAVDNNEYIGFWGGTTPKQRRQLRKTRFVLERTAS
jgi:WhiB family redox-sensing transcriptional regulator